MLKMRVQPRLTVKGLDEKLRESKKVISVHVPEVDTDGRTKFHHSPSKSCADTFGGAAEVNLAVAQEETSEDQQSR